MLPEFISNLPDLLSRSQVILCGVPADSISSMRVPIDKPYQAVPHGKIGAVQLPSRKCKDAKAAKWKYRKQDVLRIVGR